MTEPNTSLKFNITYREVFFSGFDWLWRDIDYATRIGYEIAEKTMRDENIFSLVLATALNNSMSVRLNEYAVIEYLGIKQSQSSVDYMSILVEKLRLIYPIYSTKTLESSALEICAANNMAADGFVTYDFGNPEKPIQNDLGVLSDPKNPSGFIWVRQHYADVKTGQGMIYKPGNGWVCVGMRGKNGKDACIGVNSALHASAKKTLCFIRDNEFQK